MLSLIFPAKPDQLQVPNLALPRLVSDSLGHSFHQLPQHMYIYPFIEANNKIMARKQSIKSTYCTLGSGVDFTVEHGERTISLGLHPIYSQRGVL